MNPKPCSSTRQGSGARGPVVSILTLPPTHPDPSEDRCRVHTPTAEHPLFLCFAVNFLVKSPLKAFQPLWTARREAGCS